MARRANDLNRENATLEEIERAINCSRTVEDYKRLMVIEYLYREYDRCLVEELTRFAPSTVRKFVSLFNSKGDLSLQGWPGTTRHLALPLY